MKSPIMLPICLVVDKSTSYRMGKHLKILFTEDRVVHGLKNEGRRGRKVSKPLFCLMHLRNSVMSVSEDEVWPYE